MMPSWDHPHLQCCTAQLAGFTEDGASAAVTRGSATPCVRSWRWRISAIIVATCTLSLLMFVTLMSRWNNVHGSLLKGTLMEGKSIDPPAQQERRGSWLNHTKDGHEYFLRRIKLVESQEFKNLSSGLSRMPKLQSELSSELSYDDSSSQVATSSRPPLPRPHHRGPVTSSNRHRRILVASGCSNKDISIFQSSDGSTSSMSGIPRFAVQIMNNCMSDCAPSDIHVSCGWFASALLVNPNSFKRLGYNDCIVNAGKALKHGETLRFTYANSFMYPLRFKSASFCK